MEDPKIIVEVENKQSETKNNGSGKDLNELPQRSASLENSETESTVNMSLFKEGENEESLEYSPENYSVKKKKKRKKKKAEMTNAAPDSTEQRLSSLVSNAEETGGNTDLRSQGPSVKEYEEPVPFNDSPANTKKKNKKKKRKSSNVSEDELKTSDTLEKQFNNWDIHVASAPKEEKSNSGSTVEDQGDIAVMENGKHENNVGTNSQKECDDAVSSGIENDSKSLSKDSPADTTATRKEDENAPASEKGESSISEIVPSEVKPESATMSDGAKESHVDTGPEELVESDSSDDLSDVVDHEG